MRDVICGKLDVGHRVCCLPVGHLEPHESVKGPLLSEEAAEAQHKTNRFMSIMDDLLFVLSYRPK